MLHSYRKARGLRILPLLLIALLAVSACGRDDDGNGGGELSGPGFDGESITVGVITPQTGPAAVIGDPLTEGNRVWFEAYNEEQGGIAGRYPIEMEVTDSRYQPQTAVQQYNRIEGNVAMFAQVLGTAVTTAVLPQLRNDDVLASPASLDSLWVREQQLAPLGAPYQIQAINGMDYWLRNGGSKDGKVCTMIQDDVYGEAGQAGVEFAAQQLGFEIAATARFAVGDEDFTAQIGQLRKAGCEVVFLVALPTESGTIFGTAAEAKFTPRWIGQSPMWVDELLDSPLRQYLEQYLWVMAEGPEWGDRSVPGMAEMLDDVQRFAPNQEPDFYFTYGYSQARLVTEILELAAEEGDLSREGVVAAMNDLGTVSFEGLGGDYEYGPAADRTPPRESSVFAVKSGSPFGLAAKEVNFSSDAAEAFEFEE